MICTGMSGNGAKTHFAAYGDARDAVDPKGPDNASFPRVLRGGSFSSAQGLCRDGYRYRITRESRANDVGLRVCLDP